MHAHALSCKFGKYETSVTTKLIHAGCNLRLVKALANGLPILYNHVVKEVKYDQAGVQVTAGKTVIAGAIPAASIAEPVADELATFGIFAATEASVCQCVTVFQSCVGQSRCMLCLYFIGRSCSRSLQVTC